MEKFYMKLAERTIAVSANFATTKEFCRDYLIEDVLSEVDIEVDITLEKMEAERVMMEAVKGEKFSDAYLETLALQREIAEHMPRYGVVLFHGSAVAFEGEVYLFTAPSGTGKSTHARLWRRGLGERVLMVNDDKPFLGAKDDGTILVYGAPWNGKHGLSKNIALPLKGICILSQAKENKIRQIKAGDAFQDIYRQTFKKSTDVELMKDTLHVLGNVLKYPIWKLECNISKEAFRVSYEAMTGRKMEDI